MEETISHTQINLEDLKINYAQDLHVMFYFSSFQAADLIINQIYREGIKLIEDNKINRSIPDYGRWQTLQVISTIIENEFQNHGEPVIDDIQDIEPGPQKIDGWGRSEIRIFENLSPQAETTYTTNKKKKNKKLRKLTQVSVEDTVEGEQIQEDYSQPQWEEYEYEIISMAQEEPELNENDRMEEQMRRQYIYDVEQKQERARLNLIKQEVAEQEIKKLRNFSNNLDQNKKKFTFDFDGTILVQEQLKQKKLPPMNIPTSAYASEDALKKMNQQFLTLAEQKGLIEGSQSKVQVKVNPDEKNQQKINQLPRFPAKPGIKRFQFQEKKLNQREEAIKKQQEINHNLILMDSFSLKPGVMLHLGNNFKHSIFINFYQSFFSDPTESVISKLPINVQKSLDLVLSKEKVKLTKQEWETYLQNQGNVSKLFDKFDTNTNDILIDLTLGQQSSKRNKKSSVNGSYSQLYSQKNASNFIGSKLSEQSINQQSLVSEGSVIVNDVGKLFALFGNEEESKSTQSLEPIQNQKKLEISKSQVMDRMQVSQSQILPKIDQTTNKNFNLEPIPKGSQLPFIPIGQLYKHLEKQKSQHQGFNDGQSFSQISHISKPISQMNSIRKLTRERSSPYVSDLLSNPKFLAAPRVGQTMGYGVNMNYSQFQKLN